MVDKNFENLLSHAQVKWAVLLISGIHLLLKVFCFEAFVNRIAGKFYEQKYK